MDSTVRVLNVHFEYERKVVFTLRFCRGSGDLSINAYSNNGNEERGNCQTLGALRAVRVNGITGFRRRSTIRDLRLRIIIFIFNRFDDKVSIRPFQRVLMTFVIITGVQGTFTRINSDRFTVVPYRSFRRLLCHLNACRRLFFVVYVCSDCLRYVSNW